MKSTVQVVEVGPRDGLQNEREVIDTSAKIALINRLIDAGARRIEVASFVNPRRVPQMADGDAVIGALPDRKDVSYIGLCLNLRGVERAIASRDGGARGVDEAGCVLVASDTFGIRNQGQTIVEGIAANRDMLATATRAGLVPQVTISAAFGCPFEGDVPAQRIVDLAKAMAEAGAVEITLADTIGVGVPAQVGDLFGAVAAAVPGIRLRAHFHDTRGTGIANAWAAYNAGVHVLDASVGGIGGCPFAPKATGNIATEDLLYMLDNSGVSTGVDLPAMIGVNRWFAGILGRELPSRVARAAA
ncbi:hydroxymethylglutaryl-CoA lyase [Polymorphobacter megasporae]|uniref:hydroxymethylglutaryl-CoA lyase n=1 Tax=Glacieibacterium megasporae TaxID=2835787 RepID=UPI001C1E263A|nr:hydroxymethylglutaryl-CoA lyase [Polymorphobacter megasporae]UAJ08935.1 hydroxymethylglutaryl-CoA lyase [Polymorphobacter megasporae]